MRGQLGFDIGLDIEFYFEEEKREREEGGEDPRRLFLFRYRARYLERRYFSSTKYREKNAHTI